MSKVDEYRRALKGLASWEQFLLEESKLPGPRANLELAFAVAVEGEAAVFEKYANLDALTAPTNSKEEFLAFCGTLGLGFQVADGRKSFLKVLRKNASDSRWRIREAVALGLQQWGRVDLDGLIEVMQAWADGNLLEQRAVVAALCEPNLLNDRERASQVFDLLEKITVTISEEEDRKSEGFTALRKALGYGWSVAVAAQPEIGKARLEKWVQVEDRTIRWIIKENLKKKRLERMDKVWVIEQIKRLG